MSKYKDFVLKVKETGDKTLTFTQFKAQIRAGKFEKQKPTSITNTEMPTTKPNPSNTKPIKKYVGEVEKPNTKDYESGFGLKITSDEIDAKYKNYTHTFIESYLAVLSKKWDNDFTWRIAEDAQHLRIYDNDDKLFKTVPLVHIAGDKYLAVFNEIATEKTKAHQAIAYVIWFM